MDIVDKSLIANKNYRYKKYLLKILFFIPVIFICNSTAFCQRDLVKTIYFKPGSYSIDKKYQPALNLVAKQLSSDSFGYLKVFGYADRKGTKAYNELLSEKRTNAVYNYLAAQAQIDTTRVYITWLGESPEDYDLHFPPAHTQQRCVDVFVQF